MNDSELGNLIAVGATMVAVIVGIFIMPFVMAWLHNKFSPPPTYTEVAVFVTPGGDNYRLLKQIDKNEDIAAVRVSCHPDVVMGIAEQIKAGWVVLPPRFRLERVL